MERYRRNGWAAAANKLYKELAVIEGLEPHQYRMARSAEAVALYWESKNWYGATTK